jgi:hypothetical protein
MRLRTHALQEGLIAKDEAARVGKKAAGGCGRGVLIRGGNPPRYAV